MPIQVNFPAFAKLCGNSDRLHTQLIQINWLKTLWIAARKISGRLTVMSKSIADLYGMQLPHCHGDQAVLALRNSGHSYVKSALHRDDIGDIDLIW
ncbi:MAG: hypothetical protein IJ228_12315 [Succinivibrio sp.]|nr:hypothetical protein [Succinivibrio sp.]